ncbi:MAG TPA: arginine repressor [Candidatus Baltobacteraceae bacterium]|jgi:transcriptional regulator of arginine metabolism|nr:arginine repressor [Candidatus Baltobacteraceae bacterium]
MKDRRQRAILTLVATRPVRSQDELAELLESQGFEATQATVSRDIKELGLAKVPIKDGGAQHFKYVVPQGEQSYASRLHRLVAELVRSVKSSVNLIVLRTPPGSAMMVATAIDEAQWPEIIGTIGGDDTILVIVSDAKFTPIVVARFNDLREPA